jgi:hypothetical protein
MTWGTSKTPGLSIHYQIMNPEPGWRRLLAIYKISLVYHGGRRSDEHSYGLS